MDSPQFKVMLSLMKLRGILPASTSPITPNMRCLEFRKLRIQPISVNSKTQGTKKYVRISEYLNY